MSALRSILEIFGTFDTAVARSADPQVHEIAAQMIPGDPGNTGWFAELDAYMFPGGNTTDPTLPRYLDPPRTEADFTLALKDAVTYGNEPGNQLSVPELARLAYGVAAVSRLDTLVPGSVPGWNEETEGLIVEALLLAAPPEQGPEPGLRSGPEPGPEPDSGSGSGPEPDADAESGAEAQAQAFAEADAEPAPEANPEADAETEPTDARAKITGILKVLRSRFSTVEGFAEWGALAGELAKEGLLDPRIAHTLLESATVVPIDGVRSLVIDTEFTSDGVSLNDVKAVADPRNWHHNYPAFFCEMVPKGKRGDDWRRVLETVGVAAIPYSRRLRTHLKFYKSVGPGLQARLDYDLNDPVPDALGDRQIDVDRGYINMWGLGADADAPGVTVRTRKIAHIKGIRPETQARFAFVFGYTGGALDMLIGSASKPKPNRPVPPYYPWDDSDDYPADPLKLPETDNSVATTFFKMAVSYAEDVTVKNLDLADKWLAGKLTIQDLADYSTEVGSRLAGDPWKFLQAINKPKGGGS